MSIKFTETEIFKTQKAEFDAVEKLVRLWKSQPAIVEDDYPEWRHLYECALKALIDAAGINGVTYNAKG